MPSFQFTLGSVVVLGTALGLATFALWYQKRRNTSTEIPTTSKTGVSLPPEPFYLPFLEDNGTVKMGVKALKPEDVWIDIGGSYHDQMSTKKQVLDAHWDEVCTSCLHLQANIIGRCGSLNRVLQLKQPRERLWT